MLARVESNLSMDILQREQERIGGVIRDGRLYPPIGPHLTALLPLQPAADLQRRWHVVRTTPQSEMKVAKELEALKFDVFCPMQPKQIRVNPMRHRTVSRPMLPSYVFAGFDAVSEKWARIRRPCSDGLEATDGIKGVLGLIMVGERPVPVLDGIIDRLREREILENDVGRRRPKGQPITLSIAALVRVLAPVCFAGLFGFITELHHQQGKLCVELDIFGQKTPVWLTQDQVEAT